MNTDYAKSRHKNIAKEICEKRMHSAYKHSSLAARCVELQNTTTDPVSVELLEIVKFLLTQTSPQP